MAQAPITPEGESSARLLIVDDESALRAGLRDLFSLMGYHVNEAASGREALKLLESESFDLMVLDMRMPGMSGVEVMERAREMYPDLPIVILTAHASLESTIAAVKSSATDYLLKPINPSDLSATISRALQARAEQQRRQRVLNLIGEALDVLHPSEKQETPSVSASAPANASPIHEERFLRAGSLTLDCQKRLAMIGGEPPDRTVELTEREAAILSTLMKQAGQVFSPTQLACAATGYDMDKWEARNLVRTCIHRLRSKVEATPDSPRWICTVRGRGYFLSID